MTIVQARELAAKLNAAADAAEAAGKIDVEHAERESFHAMYESALADAKNASKGE
jgi:hypothetical protein